MVKVRNLLSVNLLLSCKAVKGGFSIHWCWIVLAAGFYTVFMAYGIRFSYGILLPAMIRELGITTTEAGLIYSGYFLAYAFFAPIVGTLTDRVGGRRVVALFCVVLGVGALMMGLINRWQTGFTSALIMGVGASATWTPIVALVSKWFGVKRRGRALGILTSGYGWGFGVMGILIPLIVASYGWRYCWYSLALMALSAALINALLLRSKPEELGLKPYGWTSEDVGGMVSPGRINYRSIVREAGFWLIGASYFAISFATYIAMLYTVSYVNLELDVEYVVAAVLMSVVAFSGIPGGLIIPTLSDYLGRRGTMAVCNAVVAFTLISFVSVGSNLHVLIGIAALYGAFYSAIWPIYAAYAADYFSREAAGTVVGLWTVNYGIGAMTGSAVAGYVRDVTRTFFWSFTLASLMAGLSVALILVSKLKKRVKDSH